MDESAELFATGVPNLDRLLGGGIPRGSMTLVLGIPGAGKTTIVSQIAFAAAHAGHNTLIMTALAEPVSKLIHHLSKYTFFDADLIGGRVQFHSIEQLLSGGLEAAGDHIVAAVRQVKADFIVLDGFQGVRDAAEDPQTSRRFLYGVATILSVLGVTTLITVVATPTDHQHFPEMTTADVILNMHYQLEGGRHHRGVEVVKVRGMAPVAGMHVLTLDHHGVQVYPQLEERVVADMLAADSATEHSASGVLEAADASTPNRALRPDAGAGTGATRPVDIRAAFALSPLDRLLHGGLTRETSTLLTGSLGTGKTLLALHFALAGARAGEPVCYVSFRETRAQLLRAAADFAIGPELQRALRPGGGLSLLHFLAVKLQPDVVADQLLAVLDQTQARRLIIDSIGEIEDALIESTLGAAAHRRRSYLAALVTALRARGVTTLFIKDTGKAISPTLEYATDPLAVLAENVLLVQQMPIGSTVRRVLSVLKMRYSDHDTSVHEFRIRSPHGIVVLGPLGAAEQRTVNREQRLRRRPPPTAE